jgi:hypothetical protein
MDPIQALALRHLLKEGPGARDRRGTAGRLCPLLQVLALNPESNTHRPGSWSRSPADPDLIEVTAGEVRTSGAIPLRESPLTC